MKYKSYITIQDNSNKVLEEVEFERGKLVDRENEKSEFIQIKSIVQQSIDKILFLFFKF